MVIALVTSPSLAVKTAFWTHEQPKDFTGGDLDGVVVTSTGEVMLARETQVLYELEDEGQVVNALARAGDGRIYAATGPKGVIYQLDGNTLSEFAVLPEGGTVLSLLFARDGNLLAGTGGGDQARIYRIDGTGAASVFYEPPDAKYVWAMARDADGVVYAATGIEGQLHKIAADGASGEIIADVKPKNLLCLAIGPDGLLYTGTDEEGLIYRINPADHKSFVMYDAKEAEISSIVFDKLGNIYASTADADAARPGRAIADAPGGTPDHAETQPRNQERKVITVTRVGDPASTQPADQAPATKPADAGGKTSSNGGDERSVGRSATATGKNAGNAIYRINAAGFVTEVFREPVMILAMVESNGTLYAATGNEGRIYSIRPDEEKITMLTRLEASQATTLLRLPPDRILIGTANAPALVEVADRFRGKGTLTSEPLDADQIVNWGRVMWKADVPAGTSLAISTRSSNVGDIESEAWDQWSPEMDAASARQISSFNARFLQYRVTLGTTVEDASPRLRQVKIARVEQNQPPLIKSLVVGAALDEAEKPGAPSKIKAATGAPGPGGLPMPKYVWVARWEAEDPNDDDLVYDVFYRELGAERWIRLEKETSEDLHLWDTRTMPDGLYEVRVVASDVQANPPGTERTSARVSEAFRIDNTLPTIEIVSVEPVGRDGLRVHARMSDEASILTDASYTLNSNDEWWPLAADDDVFDSPNESATFTVKDLDPGEHRIAIRVRDEQGNTRYASRLATAGN